MRFNLHERPEPWPEGFAGFPGAGTARTYPDAAELVDFQHRVREEHMGENTPNIDNRYSPIYQRGGTGAPHASPGSHWIAPEEPPRRQGASPELRPSRPTGEPANVVEVMPQEARRRPTPPRPGGGSTPLCSSRGCLERRCWRWACGPCSRRFRSMRRRSTARSHSGFSSSASRPAAWWSVEAFSSQPASPSAQSPGIGGTASRLRTR